MKQPQSLRTLTLSVKREYFEQMASGAKLFEYRLRTSFWAARLVDKHYDQLVITLGYPKREDAARRLVLEYAGYELQTITHPHFGPEPVDVYAIRVIGALNLLNHQQAN